MTDRLTSLSTAAALVAALVFSAGCEKLKSTAAKLAKQKAAESAISASPADPSQIVDVTKANYDSFVARTNALVIIDYNATWCGPCKRLSPVLEKAAGAHRGVVYVGKVDVDKSPDLAQAQGVQGIPDVRIFRDGKQVDRFVGFSNEAEVLDRIGRLAKGIAPSTPAATPAEAKAEPEIKPYSKDWLPPGMSRPAGPAPRPQPAAPAAESSQPKVPPVR